MRNLEKSKELSWKQSRWEKILKIILNAYFILAIYYSFYSLLTVHIRERIPKFQSCWVCFSSYTMFLIYLKFNIFIFVVFLLDHFFLISRWHCSLHPCFLYKACKAPLMDSCAITLFYIMLTVVPEYPGTQYSVNLYLPASQFFMALPDQ